MNPVSPVPEAEGGQVELGSRMCWWEPGAALLCTCSPWPCAL